MASNRDRGVVTAIFHVCSGLLILQVSSTRQCLGSQNFPIDMYGWEPTIESLVKPILKQVCSGWHQKEIEVWLLLSSMYAVVCTYYKSHQHVDAKIVKIFQ